MNNIIESALKNKVPLFCGAIIGLALGVTAAPLFYDFPSPSKIECEYENATTCKVRYSCPVGHINNGAC